MHFQNKWTQEEKKQGEKKTNYEKKISMRTIFLQLLQELPAVVVTTPKKENNLKRNMHGYYENDVHYSCRKRFIIIIIASPSTS